MVSHLLHNYATNLDYARRLVADLSTPESLCRQPASGMNHAAWVLGHLAWACGVAGPLLGLDRALDELPRDLFGTKSSPQGDPSLYPPKDQLLDLLDRGHAVVALALPQVPPERWTAPLPDENFRKRFPTIGDALVYLTGPHEAMHLGQLSAWRRAQGLPQV